ncbi:MAG: hypothetical protein MJ114_00065 [Acetatifactor sp.]|nr:hypothetical protein [Acetatifactor sp.]
MWECAYAGEPADYRLIGLRLYRKIWVLILAALAGVLLVGGGYSFSKLVLGGGRTYQAESVCYIDYAEDGSGSPYEYYNYYTWNELVHTDYFVDNMAQKLSMSREEIIASTAATIDSDVRYLYLRCTTHDPALSLKLAAALEEVTVGFAQEQKEIAAMQIVKEAREAKDNTNFRLKNACILGGCIGFFAGLCGLFAFLCVDTSLYLPSTLEKRYGLLALGAPSMKEFADNCAHALKDAQRIALVPGEQNMTIPEGLLKTKAEMKVFGHVLDEAFTDAEYDKLRNFDTVVLVVKAGNHNGRRVERTLEQLKRQQITVSAAVLVDENEKLIRQYYGK